MFATLITHAAAPRTLHGHNLNLYENTGYGYIGRAFRVGELMGAAPSEVSVLDAGPDFIVWLRPSKGRNRQAEQVLSQFITSATFGGDEDDLGQVFGPVLILSARQVAPDTLVLVAPAPVSLQDWLPEANKVFGDKETMGAASYVRSKETMLNERLTAIYDTALELGCSQELLDNVAGGYAQGYRERVGAELVSRVAYHDRQRAGATREQLFPLAQQIGRRQWALIEFHRILPALQQYMAKETNQLQ